MPTETKHTSHFADIFGFACNQGFLFSIFYLNRTSSFDFGGATITRADLLFALIFMALTFVVVRFCSQHVRHALLSSKLMFGYALLLVAAQVVPLATHNAVAFGVVVEGVLIGIPQALLFCAWGRLLGSRDLNDAMQVVIAGSVCAAFVCFVLALMQNDYALLVFYLLPLGCASALRAGLSQESSSFDDALPQEVATKAQQLSSRIVIGAAIYGMATGFTESFAPLWAESSAYALPLALLFFGLLGIAALQLFSTAADGEGGTLLFGSPQGALAYLYRIVVFMMIVGYLFTPVLQGMDITGQSITLAGYIGLTMTFTILFLTNAVVMKASPVLMFAVGFGALFMGEALGIALGNMVNVPAAGDAYLYGALAVAGLLVLLVFMFFFTESDLAELSTAAQAADNFEEVCAYFASTFGLSKREAEILPLALKGRTGERIAEEFVISKSTVDTHLRRIYAKCGVHSRQELIDLGEEVAERNV